MRQGTWRTAPLCLLLGAGPAPPSLPDDLQGLLERLSRTAVLFHDRALGFTCNETISWRQRGALDGQARFDYIFAYDEAGVLEDYRTHVSAGRRRSAPEEVDPIDSGVPSYVRSAYLWILTFHESRHPLHRYRRQGEERILGVDAVKIGFEPIPPYQDRINDWFGTAWVDPAAGQLLRVVAYRPGDEKVRRRLEAFRRGEDLEAGWHELRTITTDFTEVENGLRLPGRVHIEDAAYWTKSRKHLDAHRMVRLELEQRFRRYRFFSVRSGAEIRNFIQDGKPLP